MNSDPKKGRRLLAVHNLILSEGDPSKRMKLRKEEVALLAELGNISAALSSAEALVARYPEWPAGHAAAADIACRAGRWMEAEELFARAAELHRTSGREDACERLRTGPLYRLAEARGDHARCLERCASPGELATVLTARSMRLLGRLTDLPASCAEPLSRRLLMLESAWAGGDTAALPETALEWGGPEPEWRWRFIVEGLDLHVSRGGSASDWRQAVAETKYPILDPRFGKERNRFTSMEALR